MRIAVIADIHGNLPALEAVLADIKSHAVDLTLDLGDCLSGPLWPAETAALLGELRLPTVRGNHDRWLGTVPRALQAPSDAFAFDRTTSEIRERLCTLPATLTLTGGVMAFHATPTSDERYLLEDVVGGRMTVARPSSISERLDGARAPLMLCGHSHQARIVRGPSGELIVNPGSVGCPGYTDAAPPYGPHASEAGSPHARYAIATERSGCWTAELIAVDYDWMAAARRAEGSGRSDWARALATGYVA